MAISTPLFTQHSREWQANRYVYPVISRRSRGLSIGVNLNPDKACNFDCVYCSVDRKTPGKGREVDLPTLRAELDHMLGLAASGALFADGPLSETPAELKRINDVAFSGDGEPTACPAFGDAARLAAELIAARSLEAKIVVITNATLLAKPEVAQALAFLDAHRGEVWAKLDAGTEAYYQLVDRTKVPLARVLDNLRACGRLRPIVIQSLFMRLQGEPPTPAEIAAYIGRLRDLLADGCRIALVQVYTTARQTAESFVSPLTNAEVDAIAHQVRAIGVEAEAYYGPA
ncbi:MAG: radical SAM protein [Planctomycetes bacterium]|nr:radical SAM protein [Planctomycetota bacterium]